MKRTTIYLEADLEMRLKSEVARQGRPMAQLVREAVEVYLAGGAAAAPPGAGAFSSGSADTADRAEDLLASSGFAEWTAPKPRRRARKGKPRR